MKNPYLQEFKTLMNKNSRQEFLSFLERDKLVHQYSWAIPNQKAIEKIAAYSPVIEIGAGTGYWASLVQSIGGDILAFDAVERTKIQHPFYVREGSKEQIPLHPRHTLFLCWPPYNNPLAFECLIEYKGDTVIYVGEAEGGCTGDDDFFTFLEANYNLVETIDIPQYPGLHDFMWVYQRKI